MVLSCCWFGWGIFCTSVVRTLLNADALWQLSHFTMNLKLYSLWIRQHTVWLYTFYTEEGAPHIQKSSYKKWVCTHFFLLKKELFCNSYFCIHLTAWISANAMCFYAFALVPFISQLSLNPWFETWGTEYLQSYSIIMKKESVNCLKHLQQHYLLCFASMSTELNWTYLNIFDYESP